MRSRPILAASRSNYRRMPATARRPILRGWRTVRSTAMWRQAEPAMPLSTRTKNKTKVRSQQNPRRPPQHLRRHRRVSRPCAQRSRPVDTQALIGSARYYPSRCSGRSNRREGFVSSCVAASRKYAVNGLLSVPSTTFEAGPGAESVRSVADSCWSRIKGRDKVELKLGCGDYDPQTLPSTLDSISLKDYPDRLLGDS